MTMADTIRGMYQAAVSVWGIAPSEFWAMSPREWWWIWSCRNEQAETAERGMTKEERDALWAAKREADAYNGHKQRSDSPKDCR